MNLIVLILVFVVEVSFSFLFHGCKETYRSQNPATICTFDHFYTATFGDILNLTFCFKPKQNFRSVTITINEDLNIFISKSNSAKNMFKPDAKNQVSLTVTKITIDYLSLNYIINGLTVGTYRLSYKNDYRRKPVLTFLGEWEGSRNFINISVAQMTNCNNRFTHSRAFNIMPTVTAISINQRENVLKDSNFDSDDSDSEELIVTTNGNATWYTTGCLVLTIGGACCLVIVLKFVRAKKIREVTIQLDLTQEELRVEVQRIRIREVEDNHSYILFDPVDEPVERKHLGGTANLEGPTNHKRSTLSKEETIANSIEIPKIIIQEPEEIN